MFFIVILLTNKNLHLHIEMNEVRLLILIR